MSPHHKLKTANLFKNKQTVRAIGLLIFVYILLSIDSNVILRTLYNANLKYIFLASLLIPIVTVIKSLRWQLLLKIQGIDYSLKDCFIMYYVGLYVGAVTPGRVGDFAKVLHLKKDGHAMSKSMFSVLIDRLYDMVLLIAIIFFSIFVFVNIFNDVDVFSFALYILLLLTIIISIMNKRAILKLIKFTQNISFLDTDLLEKHTTDFFDGFKKLNIYNIILLSIISLLAWIIYYILMYLLAIAINIDIPFLYLVACVSFSAAVTLLPISISGIGTRDAILIFLFSKIGLSTESAVAFSIMILGMYVFNGIIGLLAWMKKPINL